jgi:hypothetical protein
MAAIDNAYYPGILNNSEMQHTLMTDKLQRSGNGARFSARNFCAAGVAPDWRSF